VLQFFCTCNSWQTSCYFQCRLSCTFTLVYGPPIFFRKGPRLLLWTGSRAARVKITVYGTYDRLNWKIIHIIEFCHKNATLLYYVNCLNNRKCYPDKNLKRKSLSLPLFSLWKSRCTFLSAKVTLYFQVDRSRGFILTKDNCIIV
jgi:hypothetical protein